MNKIKLFFLAVACSMVLMNCGGDDDESIKENDPTTMTETPKLEFKIDNTLYQADVDENSTLVAVSGQGKTLFIINEKLVGGGSITVSIALPGEDFGNYTLIGNNDEQLFGIIITGSSIEDGKSYTAKSINVKYEAKGSSSQLTFSGTVIDEQDEVERKIESGVLITSSLQQVNI